MIIQEKNLNQRRQYGKVVIAGDRFACDFRVEWKNGRYGVYPRDLCFAGAHMPHHSGHKPFTFGFASPWEWVLDLDAVETEAGVVVLSQGYRSMTGSGRVPGRIPFIRSQRFFWDHPEMILEVAEMKHLSEKTYLIRGVRRDDMMVDPASGTARYSSGGVTICWQFHPMPVWASYLTSTSEWVFEFESEIVEALILWSSEPEPFFPILQSISTSISKLNVKSVSGERVLDTREKHQCLEPGELVFLPEGEIIATGIAFREEGLAGFKNGLWDFAVRRVHDQNIQVGAARVFSLDWVAESEQFPALKPYLVRAMRSLVERRVFNVVPEDDPGQYYQWGTNTWPRCFSVTCLDQSGFIKEAYGYLEFMLDASRQFLRIDGVSHLYDSFLPNGQYQGDWIYDVNGHSIKLYEAGKFYLNHRQDCYGKKLIEEHYQTLKEWCDWIEQHMDSEGLVQDITESNVWNRGSGVFTQAPAAAGVKLFLNIAQDACQQRDFQHFSNVLDKMMSGLNIRLFGDASNPYFMLPKGLGECFTTYVPKGVMADLNGNLPVQIGLSCYSLAANYFLQDPDVDLLSVNDVRAEQTLRLAMEYLKDPFDSRIIRWHIGYLDHSPLYGVSGGDYPHPSHMGYGQGQLLMALVYAGWHEEFKERLKGLFDVSFREVGDPYLMQEVLNRSGSPNRGNKAQLTYYPVLAAHLAKLAEHGRSNPFIEDLIVRRRVDRSEE